MIHAAKSKWRDTSGSSTGEFAPRRKIDNPVQWRSEQTFYSHGIGFAPGRGLYFVGLPQESGRLRGDDGVAGSGWGAADFES